ncbi:RNA polymerase, sigma 28 subunit, SigD/FliA/WhiG [Balnearium lithotrophicum]|uniref:RNA polymerase, sigma 28 subunit, SigD/FliA/WhiG n=1 Tax=Balnearium lithotrophicum TaxID=223788 RepID=A0A521CAS3_9BACT|nr:sigma-70 family RNA polymerase sigma factor [Balnearium lithotrophicum]SMO56506.1 RNA polymerase, sigma 28 subunit, SigD/FliA/WhiG [Balnearium lithotrophicum]
MYRRTKTKKEIVLENLPLVKKIAGSIYRRIPEGIIDFDELVNTGVIGLIKAVENYNEKKSSFSTYAYIKIRGEILDYLRKLDPLPRNIRNKIKKSDWNEIKDEVSFFISIERELFNGSDTLKIKDTLVSSVINPETDLIKKELTALLSRAIGELSEREQLVLQLLFVEELDLKSVAEILGVTVSRVSQIKAGALKKLKDIFKTLV